MPPAMFLPRHYEVSGPEYIEEITFDRNGSLAACIIAEYESAAKSMETWLL